MDFVRPAIRQAMALRWSWPAPDAGFAVYVFAAIKQPVPAVCGSLAIPPAESARLEEAPVLAAAGYSMACGVEVLDAGIQSRWASSFSRIVRRAPFPADRASFAFDAYELLGICLGAIRCQGVSSDDLKRLRQIVASAEEKYTDAPAYLRLLGLLASHVVSQPWGRFSLGSTAALDVDDRCLGVWLRRAVPALKESLVSVEVLRDQVRLLPQPGETDGCAPDVGRLALRYACLDELDDAAPPKEQSVAAPPLARLTFLLVGTEWRSGHGGLSSFNRELCVQLAACGHRVFCLVPEATKEDIEAAAAAKVELVLAARLPGIEGVSRLHQKVSLPLGVTPDAVVGHGRVTGPAANAICKAQFPSAARIHFAHVSPGAIEWYKPHSEGDVAERADSRERVELETAKGAAVVAAVGPLLTREFRSLLHPHRIAVIEFTPGLPANLTPAGLPPGCQCLLLGRVEDAELKGVDIARAAFARLHRERPDLHPTLVVRGASPGQGTALHDDIWSLAGVPKGSVRVKPFSSNAEDIEHDMLRSSVVLMPSHSEGFGLVGLEAIALGIPVLLSGNSGLGELIQVIAPADARHHIVDVTDDMVKDSQVWGERLVYLVADLEAAFGRVRRLRALMQQQLSWGGSIERLVKQVDEWRRQVAATG